MYASNLLSTLFNSFYLPIWQLVVSFPIITLFLYLALLHWLASPEKMLNSRSDRKYPCLVLDHKRKASNLYYYNLYLLWVFYITLKKCFPIFSFLKLLKNQNRCWMLSAFCINWNDHLILFFNLYYIDYCFSFFNVLANLEFL